MPIDSSIYFQQEAPDILGGIQKGMAMRQMMDQRDAQQKQMAEQQGIDNALKDATTVGPDGKVSVDQSKAMLGMSKASPRAAFEYQQKFQEQNAAAEKAKFDKMKRDNEAIYNILGNVSDQKSWEAGLDRATKLGLDTKDLDRVYIPEVKQALMYKASETKDIIAMKEREKQFNADQKNKDREFALKEKELGGKTGQPAGLTEGEKFVDKDYAKDYNDFTGGGAAKAQDAITKLEGYKTLMEKDTGLVQSGGGPISGSLPDVFRTQSSIAQRDNIMSAANAALKATFGGSLSDGERKAAANEFYNDKLSNEENIKIITQKIAELKNGYAAQVAKAKHYRDKRSLKGFAFDPEVKREEGMFADAGPKVFKTKDIEWAD